MDPAAKNETESTQAEPLKAWNVRQLRSALVSDFMDKQSGRVHPVENYTRKVRGYLAGQDVFQAVYEQAIAIVSALVSRRRTNLEESVAMEISTEFESEFAEILEAKGARVRRTDPSREAVPRTARGDLNIVALARSLVSPETAQMSLIPQGSPPKIGLNREVESHSR